MKICFVFCVLWKKWFLFVVLLKSNSTDNEKVLIRREFNYKPFNVILKTLIIVLNEWMWLLKICCSSRFYISLRDLYESNVFSIWWNVCFFFWWSQFWIYIFSFFVVVVLYSFYINEIQKYLISSKKMYLSDNTNRD